MQKIGKFCNYLNFKDAYSFLSGDKILCSLYFDSCPSLGHLISWTLPINVIGYTKNFACLICEQGFKNEKEARIIVADANQKGYATSCELKRLSKFSAQMLPDMCLWFVKTVVVIIKSTVVLLYPLHKRKVIASRGGGGGEGEGGEVLFYIGYIGICGAKGYGFLAVLVWNRVSISTILVWNRVWFVHSSLELCVFFRRSYFFIIRR